jgi:ATP synthase protein I
MSDKPSQKPTESEALSQAIDSQATRKLRAQRRGDRSLWFSFGTFGLIGWSVALPTLIGAATGMWIDKHYPGVHSWTLALLVAGLVLGCAQAWHWISEEEKKIRREERNDHE